MTAAEARKLARQADSQKAAALEPKVLLVLNQWLELIAATAAAGDFRCSSDSLPRLRTPIPSAARAAAVGRLVALGYSVREKEGNYRGDAPIEVSW